MSFIWNWIEPKVTAVAKTGIQAGGTLAGNAVGGVGSLVEGAGQSAASGVTGGVGGVADYINGYGEKIKRSMSADGPVSTPSSVKKTAVKPSAPTQKKPAPAQKALPAGTQSAKKALPPSGGVSKSAASQKSTSTPRPAGQKPPARATPKSSGSGLATGSRPASSSANKVTSTTTPSGKVVISAASRPKPAGGKTTTKPGNAPTTVPKDPLGIGQDYGKVGNTKPQTRSGGQKGAGGAPRKTSAADPLALGSDIGSIGKKK